MRKHLRYIAVAVAAASLIGLAGCSGASSDGGKTTITLMTADPQKNLQPALDGFAKKYPDITVKYSYVPFDQYNNLVKQRIGSKDTGVDAYVVDSGTVGDLSSKGYLVDLTSDFGTELKANELPATVEANTYKGKVWSLPLWDSGQVLYYNKDLLAKAGIPDPSQDPSQRMTYEQLLEDGKKAQAAGAKWGVLFDQIDRYYQLQPVIESAGGGSGVKGKDLLTADIDNDGWKKAMKWYSSLFTENVAPRGIATEQMAPLFASGQAAFIISGPWQATTNKADKAAVTYGTAPTPTFDGGKPAMATGSWNVGLNPASKHMDEAKKLIQYLTLDPEGNFLAHEAGGAAPTNKKAFQKFLGEVDSLDAPNTAGFGKLLLHELTDIAVNRPNSPGFTQLTDVTGRAFDDIRNGQPVDSTLSAAQKELQGDWNRLK
jgi:ABC-type glycerol-3-phosphate transport system substrate-binding protein